LIQRSREGPTQRTVGIYIAASLMWLWAAEGQRPTVTDLIGATLAMIGALIIIGFASRSN